MTSWPSLAPYNIGTAERQPCCPCKLTYFLKDCHYWLTGLRQTQSPKFSSKDLTASRS